MSRPRRSIPSKNYAAPSSEDENDTQMGGSGFDSGSDVSSLSDESNLQEDLSDVEDSESSVAVRRFFLSGLSCADETCFQEQSPEPPKASLLFPVTLTNSQIHQTRALVTEQEAQAVQLQAKYESHSKLAQAFKLELIEMQKCLIENRARIAPINRVPTEVLGVIFAMHVGENQESPWLLMQVSRAWRATSLLTRDLWRGVMLVTHDWFSGRARNRVFEGMQICMNESHLKGALERVGSLPLDLRIAASPPRQIGRFRWPVNHHTQTKATHKSTICDLLNALLKHIKVPRIRSLVIDTSSSFNLPNDALDGFSFADMVTLNLDFNYVSIIAKAVKESLQLQKIELPSTSMRLLKNLGRWHNMDGLTVTHVCGDNLTNIRSILVAATHLTSLQFYGDVLKLSGGERLVMPSLKHLSIKHTDPFWPITCSNLTHLTMGPFSDIVSPPDQSISLPYLIELVFSTFSESAGVLRGFKVPSLRKLVLQQSSGRHISAQGFKELWPLQLAGSSVKNKAPSDVEPRVLHLHNFSINPKLLARTLNERPLVEEFRIDIVMLDSEFFEALVPVRTAKGKGGKGKGKGATKAKKVAGSRAGWIGGCPELKRLFIDLSHFRNKEEQIEATTASAKTFVTQRLQKGTPLERLSINFGTWQGWKEFVEVENGL